MILNFTVLFWSIGFSLFSGASTNLNTDVNIQDQQGQKVNFLPKIKPKTKFRNAKNDVGIMSDGYQLLWDFRREQEWPQEDAWNSF